MDENFGLLDYSAMPRPDLVGKLIGTIDFCGILLNLLTIGVADRIGKEQIKILTNRWSK